MQLYVQNPDVISFFKSYLGNRKQQVLINGTYSSFGSIKHGVPQGSVLGPLLFCIFINDLPLCISNETVTLEMFADDTTVHSSDTDITIVNQGLQKSLHEISNWCASNCMIINPIKTKSMVITTRQKHQRAPLSLNLFINNKTIEQVTEHKILGIKVDSQFKWLPHIESVCKKISRNLFLLSTLRYYTDVNSRLLFYNAHIRSHIDYISTAWDGASHVHLKKLNSLHRRAVKLILPEPLLSTDQKLNTLGLLPLETHLKFNKLVLMFKVWNTNLPKLICDLFTKPNSPYSTSRKDFYTPLPRIDTYKSSLSFSGTSVWNSLPPSLKSLPTLTSFKNNLLKYLQK